MEKIPEKLYNFVSEDIEGALFNISSFEENRFDERWDVLKEKAEEIYFSGNISRKLNTSFYAPYLN